MPELSKHALGHLIADWKRWGRSDHDLGLSKVNILHKLMKKGPSWFLSVVGHKPQMETECFHIEETFDTAVTRAKTVLPNEYLVFMAHHCSILPNYNCKGWPQSAKARHLGLSISQYRTSLRKFHKLLTILIESDYPQLIVFK